MHEHVRSSLAPSPSTGTCPSPIEGRGTQERWRAVGQKDIAAKTNATQVTKCGASSSGSIPAEGQAQAQRCSSRGSGADSAARVVTATRVCQGARGERWEVMSPSERPPHPISQRDGSRTGREEHCLQSTKYTHPIVGGRWFPDEVEAIALSSVAQFRGEASVSGQCQSGAPTPKLRSHVMSLHLPHHPPTDLPTMDGIEPYMKERELDEDEFEKPEATTTRRRRRTQRSKKGVQNARPRGGGDKLQQFPITPLRFHAEPLIFRRFTTSFETPLMNGRMIQKIAKEEKHVQIYRHIGGGWTTENWEMEIWIREL